MRREDGNEPLIAKLGMSYHQQGQDVTACRSILPILPNHGGILCGERLPVDYQYGNAVIPSVLVGNNVACH